MGRVPHVHQQINNIEQGVKEKHTCCTSSRKVSHDPRYAPIANLISIVRKSKGRDTMPGNPRIPSSSLEFVKVVPSKLPKCFDLSEEIARLRAIRHFFKRTSETEINFFSFLGFSAFCDTFT
jgi:hypothetical protein